ncbi:hypothetical protein GCM10009555_060850 [Acrocarpospora macrocephala]|uniref:Uncharacterized protein n=1 Tax=Acrocarpospora macrocephala TaxID=150177 RepID=A0A5M3WPE7_9ACTN|nr:hypothetical protein Amac_036460 [Acrocarpospora macrocephala]
MAQTCVPGRLGASAAGRGAVDIGDAEKIRLIETALTISPHLPIDIIPLADAPGSLRGVFMIMVGRSIASPDAVRFVGKGRLDSGAQPPGGRGSIPRGGSACQPRVMSVDLGDLHSVRQVHDAVLAAAIECYG